MKKNILFFTFFVFAITNYVQAQRTNIDLTPYQHKDSIWPQHYPILNKTYKLDTDESILYSVFGNGTSGWKYYDEYHYSHSSTPTSLYYHYGDDYFAEDWNWGSGDDDKGEPLFCGFKRGQVLFAGDSKTRYGNVVVIRSMDNSDFALLYAHLDSYSVSVGDIVNVRDEVGTLGKTGHKDYSPHLHLALYKNLDRNALVRLRQGKNPTSSGGVTGNATNYAAKFEISAEIPADPRPNIYATNLRVFDESDTNEITQANIGEYITVRLDQNVIQPNFQGLGSYVNFYISTDIYLDSYDAYLGTKYANITSDSNPKLTKERLRLPGYTPNGNVYLIAQVDAQKVHQESNENDNIIVIPIKLNKVKDFIITQSVSSIKVEFYAPRSMKLLVVMSSSGQRPFSRTLYGWHKTVHASRCYLNNPIQFSRTGEVTISLYQVISQYNKPLFGRETDTLIPINNNCEEITTIQSARQSTHTKTSLDVLTSELMEVQVVNLFNPTNLIKKTVDKSTFDIKSLNLPSGFYVIRFADGTSKKVYLK